MSVLRLRVLRQMEKPDDQQAMDELVREVEKNYNYGTAAPSSTTPGRIFFKQGATSSDPLTVYININGTWWGG